MKEIKRGDIWLVSLDPMIGHEIQKTRPGLVVQNDLGNTYSQITIIAPLTSQKLDHVYPFEALITKEASSLDKDSKALLNQIRAIDQRRLMKKIGQVKAETLRDVDSALKISLGLED